MENKKSEELKNNPSEPFKSEEYKQYDEIENLKKEISALKEKISQYEKNGKAENKIINSPPGPRRIRWKNCGKTLRMAGGKKIIKPNQIFLAFPEEIPNGFRDIIKPLEELPEDCDSKIISITKYGIKRRGAGWFDVVNVETDKPMNEKGLRKEDAEKLLAKLS
jgi:hypothetical protein